MTTTSTSPAPPGRRALAALGSSPVLLVVLWLVWGTAFVVIKVGTDHAPPLVYAALRLGVAAVVLGAIVALGAARRRSPRLDGPARRRLHRNGLLLGATNGAAFFGLQTAGIAISDSGFSAVVVYTQPLLVALLARRVLGERLVARQVAGLVAGWVGVAIAGTAGLRLGAATPAGVALLLGSAAAWAVGSLVVKRAPPELPLSRLVLLQSAYGVVPLAVLAALVGGEVDWGWPLVASALWVGTAATAGGFAVQFVLLRRGAASVVSSWIFAVPIISTGVGAVLRDERVSPALLAGAATVGLAIWLVAPRRPVDAPVPPP